MRIAGFCYGIKTVNLFSTAYTSGGSPSSVVRCQSTGGQQISTELKANPLPEDNLAATTSSTIANLEPNILSRKHKPAVAYPDGQTGGKNGVFKFVHYKVSYSSIWSSASVTAKQVWQTVFGKDSRRIDVT